MASYSIFLTYVSEDKAYAEHVHRWGREGRLLPEDVAIDEGVAARSRRARLRRASAVVAVLGNDTHHHERVRQELALAASLDRPVVLIRVPGTTGPAPEGFTEVPTVAFDPAALRDALARYW
jgi:hypothetical protein